MRNLTLAILAILITGCVAFKAPAIIDISKSKVVVQRARMVEPFVKNSATDEDVVNTAIKACAEFNKDAKAVGLSQTCARTDQYGTCLATNYLFACKEKE